jgi:hypothetical protein
MATTPQIPVPAEDDNPWKNLKPKDIFTDPGFYKLSKEARRLIASKVSPDFGKASAADQDATLGAPVTYWNDYFNPKPPEPPGFIERIGNTLKSGFEAIGGAQVEQAKASLESGRNLPSAISSQLKQLPADLGEPPSIDKLVEQQKSMRRKKIPGLLQPGNIDLTTRPIVQNEDGSQSTVRSISFEENGKEILIPTVGDEGKILTDDEAIARYHSTGKHLGIFDNPANADKYAEQLHNDYAAGNISMRPSFQELDRRARSKHGMGETPIEQLPVNKAPLKPMAAHDRWDSEEARSPLQQGEIGSLTRDLHAANINLRTQGDALENDYKALDKSDKAQVDAFNAKRQAYNDLIKDSVEKSKKLQGLIELGQEVGAPGFNTRSLASPEMKLVKTASQLAEHPEISSIGAMDAGPAEQYRQEVNDYEGTYGQVPLAEKVMSSLGQSIARGFSFNIQKYQPQGLPGEGILQLIGESPGFLASGAVIGEVGAGAVGLAEKLPVVGKWVETLRVLPGATKIIKGLNESGVSPEFADRVLSQFENRSPELIDAIRIALAHPKVSAAIVKSLPGIEGSFVMATQSAIHDLGTGKDPKEGIKNALKFAFAGELLRYAPGIRSLAGKFKLDVDDPDISKMLDRMAIVENAAENSTLKAESKIKAAMEMGFTPSEVPPVGKPSDEWYAKATAEVEEWVYGDGAKRIGLSSENRKKFWSIASNAFREIARQRHPQYEALKNMIRDHASQSTRTAIGTALQSATAYGLAAAGNAAIETEGDLKTKLQAAGYEGVLTFLQIGGFHIPSIMVALNARAGRTLDPGDAFVEWNDLTKDERKKIVSNITPEEATQATERANEMSGRAHEVTPMPAVGEVPKGNMEKPPSPVTPVETPPEAGLPPAPEAYKPITPETPIRGTVPAPVIPTELTPEPQKAAALNYTVKAEQVGNAVLDNWMLTVPGGHLEVTFGDNNVKVDQVEVNPEIRGNGAAKALYRKLGEMMKDRGIPGNAIEGDIQGDPEIINKLRAIATEIAGEGKEGINRYDISEGALPEEMLPPPAAPAQQLFQHWLNLESPTAGPETIGQFNEWADKNLPEDLQEFKPGYLEAKAEFEKRGATMGEGMPEWLQQEATRIKEASQIPLTDEMAIEQLKTTLNPETPNKIEDAKVNGATDKEVEAIIYQDFGTRGGWIAGDNISYVKYKGGDKPTFTIGRRRTKNSITLSGAKLIDAYRKAHDIPTPKVATERDVTPGLQSDEQFMKPFFEPQPTPLEPLTERPRLLVVDGMITTRSGRKIPAPPPIRLDSNRKATIDIKKVDAWLLDQGLREAESRKDKFVTTLFKGINANNLTPSDKDSLNQYLFGHTDPDIIVKPEKLEAELPKELLPELTSPENVPAEFTAPPKSVPVGPDLDIDALHEKVKDLEANLEEVSSGTDSDAYAAAAEALSDARQQLDTKINTQLSKPEQAPPAKPQIGKYASDLLLANGVAEHLKEGNGIDRDTFFSIADDKYGGTRAEGKYGPSEAYDALELGINLYIQGMDDAGWVNASLLDAQKTITALQELQASVVSQTNRSGKKDLLQQFSTPPAYAYAIARLANIQPGDVALETSAGTGDIVVHAKKMGATVHANEIDPRRANLLKQITPNVTQYDAEQIGNILRGKLSPTVILMNPPFSHAGARMGDKIISGTDRKHIDAALSLLSPGGRLVAIIGSPVFGIETRGMGQWLAGTGAKYNIRADVKVGRDVYKGYGTTYPTRVLVIDKTGPTPAGGTISGSVDNLDGLVDTLDKVRHERSAIVSDSSSENKPVSTGNAGGRIPESSPTGGPGPINPVPVTIGSSSTGGTTEPTPVISPEQLGLSQGPGVGDVQLGSTPSPELPDTTGAKPIDTGVGGQVSKENEGQAPGTDRGDTGGKPSIQPVKDDAALARTDNRTVAPATKLDENVIFDPYSPANVPFKDVKKHPASVVESSTMAAVKSPEIDYTPDIPMRLVKSGALSDIQLELIAVAGWNHSQLMPDGTRYGVLVGDGTGIGKGRELAGVILDNWRQGRKRAVWISKNKKLFDESKRDWQDLGQNPEDVHNLSKFHGDENVDVKEGILYSTYDTLRSASRNGRSRLDQIADWLKQGDNEYDGVIVFDEAHIMGSESSERGQAARDLQLRFPKARIVYSSATAATEITSLIFAQRLGLWGDGTPFPSVNEFAAEIGASGVAAMEATALSLKAMGRYMARSISFDDGTPEGRVEYARVEHKLTQDQRMMYDRMAEAWQKVIAEIEKSLIATKAPGQAKGRARANFWSSHQRFFNMMITSMQMPVILERIEQDLVEGRSAVVQLTNTGEAAQERAVANLEPDADLDDFAVDPFDVLISLVNDHFPVQAYEQFMDNNGTVRTRPAYTGGYIAGEPQGEPIKDAAAMEAKAQLLDDLNNMNALMPESPLDMLVNTFGSDRVAEVTGRKRRFTWETQPDGGRKRVEQKRTKELSNKAEIDSFQGGRKHILVFSEAGGTGASYHADRTAKNQEKRSHYLAQAGWKADTAIQGLGRSHRSNQRQAPGYILPHTDLAGQKRFISTIARRLGQLGALTKGQRQASGSGVFSAADNLESTEARDALRQFFTSLYQGDIPGLSIDEFETQTGLILRNEQTRNLKTPEQLPGVPQFLNRLLSMRVDDQNRTFNMFDDLLKDVVARKIAAGTLDQGVETIKGKNIVKLRDQSVYRHATGAEARYVKLSVDVPNPKTTWDDARTHVFRGYASNNKTGNVWQVEETTVTDTLKDGRVVQLSRLRGPGGHAQYARLDTVNGDNYTQLTEADAKNKWIEQYKNIPDTRTVEHHMIAGVVLPIWDRLPAGLSKKIIRGQTNDGEIVLGVDIPPAQIDDTLHRLGAESEAVNTDSILQKILDGKSRAQLTNGWFIERALVQGENRLEIKGPSVIHHGQLEREGVILERIGFKYRYFIPTGENMRGVFDAVTHGRPIVKVEDYNSKNQAPPESGVANKGGKTPIPKFPVEAERGPSLLMTIDVMPPDLEMLNGGHVPPTISDRLSQEGIIQLDMTAKVTQLSPGWIIDADGRQFMLKPYTKNKLDIYEQGAYGRIESPELINAFDDILGELQNGGNIKLNNRLRSSFARFVYEGSSGKVEIRPDMFKPENREALLRYFAHEVGHIVDWLPDNTLNRGNLLGRLKSLQNFYRHKIAGIIFRNNVFRKELVALSEYWDPYDIKNATLEQISERRSPRELYADFVSALLASPGTAWRLAPNFYREWHAQLDLKPDVKEAYDRLTKQMQGSNETAIEDRLRRGADMMRRSEHLSMEAELEKNEHHRTVWGRIKDRILDKNWELEAKTKALERGGEEIPFEMNPRLQFDELAFRLQNDLWLFADSVEREVMKGILIPAGITADDMRFGEIDPSVTENEPWGVHMILGLYMYLHRSATQRSRIANPKVVGGAYATETLDLLRERIGDVKMKALEDAAHKYTDLRWKFVEEGFAMGVYPEKMRKYFEDNKYNYFKFVAQEYIDKYVSPTIKRQIGFAGEIENPWISTIKMDFALIRLNAVQGARQSVVKLLNKYYPEEIEKAEPLAPQDVFSTYAHKKDMDIIEIFNDGKLEGHYVDKYIADAVNLNSAEGITSMVAWMKHFHDAWWKIIILYNLGFGAWGNIARDFLRNYSMLDKSIPKLIYAYAKAAPNAWRWMKHAEDPVVKDMIENYEWAVPIGEAMQAQADAYHHAMSRAGLYQINGDLKPSVVRKVLRIARKPLDAIAFVVNYGDLWGKVTGHNVRIKMGEKGKELAFDMRRNTGTPAYYRKGLLTKSTNFIMPFSNMFIQGWASTIDVGTSPKTRSGYWFRTAKILSLQLMMKIIFSGMGGILAYLVGNAAADKISKAYNKITPYMRRNYFDVLLGYGADGSPFHFTMPLSEDQRVMWGVMDSMLDAAHKGDPALISDTLKFMWDQLPSGNPLYQIGSAWGSYYILNRNPNDEHRGSPVMSDMISEAGGWAAAEKLFYYSINELGLSQIQTFDAEGKNWYQKWTQYDPTLGRVVGRMFRYGGSGDAIESRRIQQRQRKSEAQESLALRNTSEDIKKFYSKKWEVTRDSEALKYETGKGGKYKDLIIKYPLANWEKMMGKYSDSLLDQFKAIKIIKASSIPEAEKKLKIDKIMKAMNKDAKDAVEKLSKKKNVELPKEFTNPPEIE